MDAIKDAASFLRKRALPTAGLADVSSVVESGGTLLGFRQLESLDALATKGFVGVRVNLPTVNTAVGLLAKDDWLIPVFDSLSTSANERARIIQLLEHAHPKKIVVSPVFATSSIITLLADYGKVDSCASVDVAELARSRPEWKWFLALLAAVAKVDGSDIHLEKRPAVDGAPDLSSVRVRVGSDILTFQGQPVSAEFLSNVIPLLYMFFTNTKSSGTFPWTSQSSAQLSATPLTVFDQPRLYRGRIQTAPCQDGGFDLVMRMLPVERKEIPTAAQLGFMPSQVYDLEKAVAAQKRMVSFAGKVGSGKSFAMRTFWKMIGENRKKHSLEDPAEYWHPNTSSLAFTRDPSNPAQSEKELAGLLGALKRMDTDAFLLGEVRDNQTAASVLDVVLSGHFVMTSIHASSAMGQIPRFSAKKIGWTADQVGNPDVIGALVYQSLLPKLCPHCKLQGADAIRALGNLVTVVTKKMRGPSSGLCARNPNGCEHCRVEGFPDLWGFKGKSVVAEVYVPEYDDYRLIQAGGTALMDLEQAWLSRRADDWDDACATGRRVPEVAYFQALQGIYDLKALEARLGPWELFRPFTPSAPTTAGGSRTDAPKVMHAGVH